MFWMNPTKDYQRLCQVQGAFERAATLPDRFAEAQPVSGWSLAAHVYHAALINAKMMEAARQLVEGSTDVAVNGRANVIGVLILTLGRIPRGKGRSPKVFAPPDDLDDDYVMKVLAESRRQLELVLPHLDALSRIEERLPHPLLGALTPKQWFRSARLHAEHHRRIMDDIAEQHA